MVEKIAIKGMPAKSLYKLLESDPSCEFKNVSLPAYNKKIITTVEFIAYSEWRGGTSNSDLGKCVRRDSGPFDQQYFCKVFDSE